KRRSKNAEAKARPSKNVSKQKRVETKTCRSENVSKRKRRSKNVEAKTPAQKRQGGRSRLADPNALRRLLFRAAIARQDRDHLRVDLRVRGHDFVHVEEVRIARVVADEPARFGHEQTARGHIPRVDALFEEAVHAARGDVREV